MSENFTFADSLEMEKRKMESEKFLNIVFDTDERPVIVTDLACLYDLYLGDESEVIHKIKNQYGVTIEPKHFRMPLWKLIDMLEIK